MKSIEEIKGELDRIYLLEKSRQKFKLWEMSPRNYAKILALEWVLGMRDRISCKNKLRGKKLVKTIRVLPKRVVPSGLTSLEHLRGT